MRPPNGGSTDKPAIFGLMKPSRLPGRVCAVLGQMSVYHFYRWGSTAPARTRGSRTPGRRSRTPRSAPRYLVRSGTIHRARAVDRGEMGAIRVRHISQLKLPFHEKQKMSRCFIQAAALCLHKPGLTQPEAACPKCLCGRGAADPIEPPGSPPVHRLLVMSGVSLTLVTDANSPFSFEGFGVIFLSI